MIDIHITDAYLDIIGAGATLADIPEELRDELASVLVSWVKEVRHNERRNAFE